MKQSKQSNMPNSRIEKSLVQNSSSRLNHADFSNVFMLAIIFLLGFLIYSNSFDCAFHFDDRNNIMDNPVIRDVTNVGAIWKHSQNRFLPFYSLAMNYNFLELEVSSYHYFNLLVHLINASLVWWLSMLVFSLPFFAKSKLSEQKRMISLFIGLLFVSHPLATQSVTYIVQRMASMVALFYFLSVIFYIKARIETSGTKMIFFIISILAGISAFLCKENSYTLPIAIVLCEVFFFQANIVKIEWKSYKLWGFLGLLASIGGLLIFNFSFSVFNPKLPSGGTNYTVTSLNYLFTQFKVIPMYIRLLFLPYNQNLDYDIEPSLDFFNVGTIVGFLFLFSLLALGVYSFKKNRILSFGIFWFFVTIVIESSIIPIEDVMFEHRTYLPSFGFFLVIVPIVYLYIYSRSKYLAYFTFVLIIGIYSLLTYQRNNVWKDDISLWDDVVSKSPNKARPYLNRGVANWSLGNWKLAMADYSQAIKLNPKYYAAAYWNLGIAQSKFAQWPQSIENFTKAIEIYPNYFDAFQGRAISFGSLNQMEESIKDFDKAIQLRPNDATCYYNRGNVYLLQKQWANAMNDFTNAIKANPNYLDAYCNRSNVYVNLKELDKALADCDKAISIEPVYQKAFKNRALIYTELKRYENAISDYTTLIQLNSKDPDNYLRRGLLYNDLKQYEKAFGDFDSLATIQPQNKYAVEMKEYLKRFINRK